jgi:hypothetical protein
MDEKSKNNVVLGCRVTKMPFSKEKFKLQKKTHVHGIVLFPNENTPSSVLPSLSFSIKPTKNNESHTPQTTPSEDLVRVLVRVRVPLSLSLSLSLSLHGLLKF